MNFLLFSIFFFKPEWGLVSAVEKVVEAGMVTESAIREKERSCRYDFGVLDLRRSNTPFETDVHNTVPEDGSLCHSSNARKRLRTTEFAQDEWKRSRVSTRATSFAINLFSP